MMNRDNICPHFLKNCGGCTYWNLDSSTEVQLKKDHLKSKLNSNMEIRVNSPSHFNIRTRFDFTLQDQKMGLYSQDRKLVDLTSCHVLHPELEKAFQFLRDYLDHNPLNIQKGSLRLRISPQLDKWGLWIDFSNVDIKKLLEEKKWLARISQKFFIEIGQKKKILDLKSFDLPQLKLSDPVPQNWFRTLDHELLCSISSFTQPSPETADLLTLEILKWVNRIQPERVIEYGCGIGQYTVPLLKSDLSVDVYENDRTALDYLKMNTVTFQKKLSVNDLNKLLHSTEKTLALVNPPRSGLQKFSKNLIDSKSSHLIYISCFVDSLASDLQALSIYFKLSDIVLINQFPRSQHYEVAVLLERI